MKKLLLAAWMLLIGAFATAQADSIGGRKSVANPRFHVIANIGLVAGASDRDLQVQLIPGLQYETWFAGVGAGLDYYFFRGIPLFLDVRKQFQKSIPLFAYVDIGWHFPSVKNQQEMQIWGYQSDFEKGLYYDAGVGWSFELGKRNKLLFSAGYSGKKATEIQTFTFSNATNRLEYNFRRLSIKVGFQF